MSLYQVGEVWYYYITIRGERHRGTTEKTNKREAQAIHDRIRGDLQQRIAGGHTLADALRLWLTEKERSRNEKNAIKQLLRLYPSRPLHEVSADAIRDLYQSKSPGTANRTFNIINAALRMAHEKGWCKTLKIKRREPPKLTPRFLTHEEWGRLESELSGHPKDIAQFALYTGLRQANVLGLMWRNVNLEKRMVWVDATDAKGKVAISVPLSTAAAALLARLEKQKAESQYVFTYKEKPVKSIKTSWNKALERACIKDFTFHDLRHTWASWHVQNGTPLPVLKELGGWKSMDMVMRYAHLAPDHLRQWVG